MEKNPNALDKFSPEKLQLADNICEKVLSPSSQLNQTANYADYLRLSYILQSSLDAKEILQHFSQEIKKEFQQIGIVFESKEENLSVKIGDTGKHSFQQYLNMGDHFVGSLIIYRDTPFISTETVILEDLLHFLIYPLNNAVNYNKVLKNALTDPLTKVGNRAAFEKALERDIAHANRHNTHPCVFFIDIDNFKLVNDQCGHSAGDHALISIAQIIKDSIRESDALFRLGGDEFAILLRLTPKNGAIQLADRLCHAISEKTYQFNGYSFPLAISIGVAMFESKEMKMAELIENADKALYQAKRRGRNRAVFWENH